MVGDGAGNQIQPDNHSRQESTMQSHEIDYQIYGNDLQVVEVELDPEESVIAEAGAMCWMDADIEYAARLGDGSEADSGFFGKVFSAGKRMVTGESLFMTHFTNKGNGKRRVAFAGPVPGHIVPVNLSATGGTLLCQRDAFLCAARGTRIGVAFTKKIGAGFFGGEGFVLQKLEGDGMAFMHAGGAVVKKDLNNQTIMVDTGCLVAFSEGIDYSIAAAGGLKTMMFGGEGMFLATLKGTGTVYLQSLPFAKLADRIISVLPKKE
jgi:uncharacterized protein (TIGR00266 family)